jgi:hypothetical protein
MESTQTKADSGPNHEKAKQFAEYFTECRGVKYKSDRAEYIGLSDGGELCFRIDGRILAKQLEVPMGSLFAAEFASDASVDDTSEVVFVWGKNIGVRPQRPD